MDGMQPDYGGMEQYVTWANATGVVQQFYTDSSIQVSTAAFGLSPDKSFAERLVSSQDTCTVYFG